MRYGTVSSRCTAIAAVTSIAMLHASTAWQTIAPSSDSQARVALGYIGGVLLLTSLALHIEARRAQPIQTKHTPVNSFTKANAITGLVLLTISAMVGTTYLSAQIGPNSQSDTDVRFSSATTNIFKKIMQTPAVWALTHMVCAAAAHAVDRCSRQTVDQPSLQVGLFDEEETDGVVAAEEGRAHSRSPVLPFTRF
ncbi:MAG: hypothetical protein P1U34_06985 [Coxiellaceae bacterium]|nr:hypothetical protein [Coxiellaceae bacterium]